MSEFVGKTLSGRYQIRSLLGEGGMGGVYKAFDPRLQREVAIKIMHRRYLDKSDFQDRFAQEAVTAAKFSHPSIVQIFDYGQAGAVRYIVMEFIPGENLDQMIRRLRNKQQWITLQEAIGLIRYVAHALDYAHQRGVFHRDIKPANIMLKAEAQEDLPYRPVITDLGLAKLAEGGLDTQMGLTMGTPAYMSPEQAKGSSQIDGRTDIYSLGILLYELTVGQLPFPIRSMTEALRYHTTEKPPTPRSIYPELPAAVETIILRALEKHPDARFPTAGEMSRALDNLPPETLTDAIPPTAIAGVGSFLTQWQESLIELRGASIVPEPPPAGTAHYQLLMRASNGREVTIKLTASTYTIGRQPDNQIQIDENGVSRYHARLDYQNGIVWVTDLDSTNGTSLGKQQLQPHRQTPWDGREPLQIGKHTFLLRADQGAGTVAPPLDAQASTQYEPPFDAAPPEGSRHSLTLAFIQPETYVEPGQQVQLPFIVRNQGATVQTVTVRLAGIPRDWLAAPLSPLHLMAGTEQRVSLTIQPPRSPQTVARRHQVRIQALSPQTSAQAVEANCTVTVRPYLQFQSSVKTLQTAKGAELQVQLENQGNFAERFQLTFRDEAEHLTFSPPHLDLQIANGQNGMASTTITPKQRPLVGLPRMHTIRTQISSKSGQSETHQIGYVTKPLMPIWLSALLFLLCVVMIGGVFWGYQGRLPFITVAQTPVVVGEASGATLIPTATTALMTQEPPSSDHGISIGEGNSEPGTPAVQRVGALGVSAVATTVQQTATPLPTATATPDLSATETTVAGTALAVAALAATATQAVASTRTAVVNQTAAAVATNAITTKEAATKEADAASTQTAIVQATTTEIAAAAAGATGTAAVIQTRAAQQTADAIAAQNATATAAAQTRAALPTPTPVPPTPTPIPARPGQVTGFENFGQWTRGDEPWGTFIQSNEQHAVDSFAGKLTYDFTTATTANDYVVFLRRPSLSITGQPTGLRMQVYGDGSGNILNAWVQDSGGTIWAFTFGQLNHRGWQTMDAPFDPSLGWPNGVAQGAQATSPAPPFSLYAIVLDGEPGVTAKGTIFLDELMATNSPNRPNIFSSGRVPVAEDTPAPTDAGGTGGENNIHCDATPSVINRGESATLSWNISGVSQIFFEGQGVTGAEGRGVSPTQTTTYTLRIIRTDGSETTCTMTVRVN